jgi:hypothetical protein
MGHFHQAKKRVFMFSDFSWRRRIVLLATALFFSLQACSPQTATDSSDIFVTDVAHSAVKRQAIGNCWLYAKASWVESLHLAATGQEVNVSESYWTWWHWYKQLTSRSTLTSIETGGWWFTSQEIILQRGVVMEGEFIADEADMEMSVSQSVAESIVNGALAPDGPLGTLEKRTPENVRSLLDVAFGTNMAAAEALARPATSFQTGMRADGSSVSLYDSLVGDDADRWGVVVFPRVWGKDSVVSRRVKKSRKEVFQRVLKALNDRHPVVMSLMIDFSALDIEDQTFKASTLEEAGEPGRQGGHMLVLEDYVVTHVPGYGTLAEGDLSAEEKQAALQGRIKHLKAKNSWGSNRPDRGLTDGYTRFDYKYLTNQLAWKNSEDDSTDVSWYTTLSDFVLPPGY